MSIIRNEKGEMVGHIAFSNKEEGIPEIDQTVRCPDHPEEQPMDGFGMAGGGYGVYTACSICGRILSKSLEPDDDI